MINFCKRTFWKAKSGAMAIVGALIGGIIGIVILAKVAIALWPTLATTGTDVAALTQTDAGTETFQAIWPIVIVVVGIGVGAAAIFYVLRKFGIVGGR